MERATDMDRNEAVIISHGSPSIPLPQDRAMDLLAEQVAALLPGWTIRGATLASRASMVRAFEGLAYPVVYPFFMADGFLTTELLPRRVAAMTATARHAPAFGSDPAIPALASEAALAGTLMAGLEPQKTALLLAAHGSQIVPASRLATLSLAHGLAAQSAFRCVRWGFLEEEPYLAEAAHDLGSAVCLPLFTLRAGHVSQDLPMALGKAGFRGTVLDHLGMHPAVPRIIAAALERQFARAAA